MGKQWVPDGDFDVAVVGFGLAGVSAALTLRSAGLHVAVVELFGDLPLTYRMIQPNPLREQSVRGDEFQDLLQSKLDAAHIELSYGFPMLNRVEFLRRARPPSEYSILSFGEGVGMGPGAAISASHVLFAPSGSQLGIGRLKLASAFPYGLSCCAADDGYFFENGSVAVVGEGRWAIEETLIVSGHRSPAKVTVILEGRLPELPAAVLALLGARPQIRIHTNAVFRGVGVKPYYKGRDRLASVAFETDVVHKVDIDGLFAAHELVLDWRGYGELGIKPNSRMTIAGFAAGVDFYDSAALWRDGERAANVVMGLLGR